LGFAFHCPILGSAPDPTGGSSQRSPRSLTGFGGCFAAGDGKGRGGKRKRRERTERERRGARGEKERDGKGEKGKESEGRGGEGMAGRGRARDYVFPVAFIMPSAPDKF